MRTEFDGVAYDRHLLREANRYWGGEAEEPEMWDYEVETETADQARERMNDEEKTADAEWEKGQAGEGS